MLALGEENFAKFFITYKEIENAINQEKQIEENYSGVSAIERRIFKNKNEIIIININFDENLLDLGYICESLNYKYLSYSEETREKLSTFVNYVINKGMNQ